jgi:hypothetical protein
MDILDQIKLGDNHNVKSNRYVDVFLLAAQSITVKLTVKTNRKDHISIQGSF